MECCICKEGVTDRKKYILLFGTSKKAVAVRSALKLYLREEGNEDITDVRLKWQELPLLFCHKRHQWAQYDDYTALVATNGVVMRWQHGIN